MKSQTTLKQFASDNFFFVAFSLIASALNYIYYPVVGRYLPTSAFAEVQIFASVLLLLGTVFSVINILTVAFYAKNSQQAAEELTKTAQIILIRIFIIGGVTLIALYPLIQGYLGISDLKLFVAFLISIIVNTIFLIAYSVLQANHEFKKMGIAGLIAAFVKLLGALLLVLFGLGSSGVVAAIAIGLAAGTLYMLSGNHQAYTIIRDLRKIFTNQKHKIAGLKPYMTMIWSALAINCLLIALFSADTFIAKHVFDSSLAGQFAAMSTLSKIVTFIAMPLGVTMLPRIANAELNQARHRYLVTTVFILIVGTVQFLVFSLFGNFVVQKSFGEQYVSLTPLLGLLTALSLFAALTYITFNYLIIRRPKLSLKIAIGMLLPIIPAVMLANRASSPSELVSYLLFAHIIILLMGVTGVILADE